jgi:hypothetical protein
MSDESFSLEVDPEVLDAARRIHEMMRAATAPKLGLDYRIVVEQNGRPVAVVMRTLDHGIKLFLVVGSALLGSPK